MTCESIPATLQELVARREAMLDGKSFMRLMVVAAIGPSSADRELLREAARVLLAQAALESPDATQGR